MGARPAEVAALVAVFIACLPGCRPRGYAAPGLGRARTGYVPLKSAPVTCLGVVDLDTKRTWGPDGAPAKVPTSGLDAIAFTREPGLLYRGIVFAVAGPRWGDPPPYDVVVNGEPHTMGRPGRGLTGSSTFGNTTYDVAGHRWLVEGITNFRVTDAQADVTIADSGGPWTELAGYTVTEGALKLAASSSSVDMHAQVENAPAEAGTSLFFTFPPTRVPLAVRAIAWDAEGHKLRTSSTISGLRSGVKTNLNFGAQPSSILQLEFQECVVKMTTFRNVNLQPR